MPLCPLLARASLSLGLVVASMACARYPDHRAEGDVLNAVFSGMCEPGSRVVIDRYIGERFSEGELDHLERELSVDLPPVVEKDLLERNREAVDLASLGDFGACSLMGPEELEVYRDTAILFQPLSDATSGVGPAEFGALFGASRPGFDRGKELAVLSLSWSGGVGMCWTDFLVLRRDRGEWRVSQRVNYIVC